MGENQEITREKQVNEVVRDERGRVISGTPNPNGRPKGTQSFSTLYKKAIENIAKSKNISPEDFEVQLVQQAIAKGFNGDRSFYADTMDRVHGKAPQTMDLMSGGEKITPVLVKFIDEPASN